MADNEWIGKKFRARCLMNLPDQGERKPGEEFTFTRACAELGLDPESWLRIGNAELVGKEKPKPGPSPDEKPDEKPKPDVKPVVEASAKAAPLVSPGKRGS